MHCLRTIIAICCCSIFSLASQLSAAELSVRGRQLLQDDRPFDMWGIRTASASQSTELTDHLIAQLDEYLAHGVNSISVYYMGSSGGYSDPFSADGKSINAEHQQRMEQIVSACNQRGMVVIVGVFYQRCDDPQLKDWQACQAAIRTVVRELRPYKNIILNVANEQNSSRYVGLPWERLRDVPDLLELCRIAKREDPERIVGAGGYDHAKNEQIGLDPAVDVLLFDTNGPDPDSGDLFERFVTAGIDNKPLINVETFGGWTGQFLPQGVFPEHVKQTYLNELEQARQHHGLYIHFHNNPWCQAPSTSGRIRYDLGGYGDDEEDPGIRWYFEAVRQAKRN